MYNIIEKNCIMGEKKWKTGCRNAAMQSDPACRMRVLYMCVEKQSAYMSKPSLYSCRLRPLFVLPATVGKIAYSDIDQ